MPASVITANMESSTQSRRVHFRTLIFSNIFQTAYRSNLRRRQKHVCHQNANGDVIGNEHGIHRADCAPTCAYFGPATILNLYRIAHSGSTVDKWDNSPRAKL
jgi:hypothetical protein